MMVKEENKLLQEKLSRLESESESVMSQLIE